MSLSNVFKMELYKNWHDRASLVIMLVLMGVNTFFGLSIVNGSASALAFIPFSFSIMGSSVFLFIYPYRMARVDYRNRVLSLLIASGVSRTQYYFVKVGATLIFSLLSVILIVFVPIIIVGGLDALISAFDFLVMLDASIYAVILVSWLSTFSILMTSVIISRGKGYTIFVFFGISLLTSIITEILFGHNNFWWTIDVSRIIVQHILITAVMGIIGILVLRKQNL